MEQRAPRRLVWARGAAAAEECPKSLSTPQSLEWVERFFAWKFAGDTRLEEMSARQADAFLMLEREWRTGSNNGEHKST